MAFQIPRPLHVEHEELHAELVKATQVEGEIGEAARTVAALLHPHFVQEEAYALPPLSLLSLLAAGQVTAEMRDVLPMTDKLQTELQQMMREHRAIVAALHHLVDAAKRANQMAYARFADMMMLHAEMEEEVLYPSAILIGEYLKLKLNI